ncbi:MAG: hypothetical protein Q9190_003485 [Brigantiaea leucoxantha]
MSLSNISPIPLRADVFTAPAIPNVPFTPFPDNQTSLWSPTTSTLIHSAHEAVLVDPLLTISQANSLADWISTILTPAQTLTTVYITHGHGDHFFGISTLLERFPNATTVATPGVLRHMEEQLSPESREIWTSAFPGNQIKFPTSPLAKTLDPKNLTIDLEGHTLHAVPAGHSDTDETTFLWVPDLKLVVAGDIVYNGAYQYLVESLTEDKRKAWLHALDKIAALKPETVVAGHKIPGRVDGGSSSIAETRRYIELWGDLIKEVDSAEALFKTVMEKDPGKTGNFILWWSCTSQFPQDGGSSRV